MAPSYKTQQKSWKSSIWRWSCIRVYTRTGPMFHHISWQSSVISITRHSTHVATGY